MYNKNFDFLLMKSYRLSRLTTKFSFKKTSPICHTELHIARQATAKEILVGIGEFFIIKTLIIAEQWLKIPFSTAKRDFLFLSIRLIS